MSLPSQKTKLDPARNAVMAGSTSVCWRENPFWLLGKSSEIRSSFPNNHSCCHGVRWIGKNSLTYFPGAQFEKVGENCHRPTISIFYILYSIFYISYILYNPKGNDLPRFLGYKHLQPLRTFPNVPTISASFTKGLRTSLHSVMLTASLIHMFLYLLDVVPLETYVRNQTNDGC